MINIKNQGLVFQGQAVIRYALSHPKQVCDACPYYVRGWDVMHKEGTCGVSYRLMYNPEKDRCMPIPVPTPSALKEGIID